MLSSLSSPTLLRRQKHFTLGSVSYALPKIDIVQTSWYRAKVGNTLLSSVQSCLNQPYFKITQYIVHISPFPDHHADSFKIVSLWETSQTLFWAAFGLIDLDNFELSGIKEFTRFWALIMFGSFSVRDTGSKKKVANRIIMNPLIITKIGCCRAKFAHITLEHLILPNRSQKRPKKNQFCNGVM